MLLGACNPVLRVQKGDRLVAVHLLLPELPLSYGLAQARVSMHLALHEVGGGGRDLLTEGP